MGRPKTYQREEVTSRAMELFWLHGFHGTSTQDLVDHMEVNRFSLFAEFGTKQGLYEAALERYGQEVVTGHFGALEQPGAGLSDVCEVLRFFASKARTPGSERGCLLCNAATERAPHDAASRDLVERYVSRLTAAVKNALGNSRRRGELRRGVDLAAEARLITATLLGFFVLLRAQVDGATMRGAARAAVKHLQGLRAPDGGTT